MIYTKIRLDFKYGPKDRFYRIVLVKGNPDLFKLGIALGTSVEATFEHAFLFSSNDDSISYVMASFMEDPGEGYKYIGHYHLSDLPSSFSFEYDTGDGWDFACQRFEEKVEVKSNKMIILLEGKGQGIWEDNIGTLFQLFDGTLSKDSKEEDLDKGISMPWNVEIEKYGDFDLPLPIAKINKSLNMDYNFNYDASIEAEKTYIEESNINLDEEAIEEERRQARVEEDSFRIDKMVDAQILGWPFVRGIYEQKLESSSDKQVRKEMTDILRKYLFELAKEGQEFDEDLYKKLLTEYVDEPNKD